MPRPSRYSIDRLLDCALDLFVEGGLEAVTVAGVARRTGAPSGSMYHRFPSRDALLARLWLRTVERFQAGYIEALGDGDPERAARRAVHHVLQWVRAHPAEGLLLLRHGAADLMSEELDEGIVERATRARQRLEEAIAAWRRRHPAGLGPARARFALIDLPYAAVRPYLQAGEPVPRQMDAVVDDALVAVLRPSGTVVTSRDQAASR